ncbi:MAG: ABC transporter substrate-binding protein, partial [Dehalococcoidia bacterium]|nr:ABC transporter substrate-binding protein [Dehalococcoidia bacterium]
MRMRTKSIALVLAIAAVAAMGLSACSDTSSSPGTPVPTGPAKPIGTLKFGTVFASMRAVDPPIGETTYYNYYASAIFDSLVMLGNDGKAKPGIAERWEISPDGKSHTFYIRKGVKFHDGSDLTAADVKFSLERFIAADATHSQAASVRAVIDGVDLKDDY